MLNSELDFAKESLTNHQSRTTQPRRKQLNTLEFDTHTLLFWNSNKLPYRKFLFLVAFEVLIAFLCALPLAGLGNLFCASSATGSDCLLDGEACETGKRQKSTDEELLICIKSILVQTIHRLHGNSAELTQYQTIPKQCLPNESRCPVQDDTRYVC